MGSSAAAVVWYLALTGAFAGAAAADCAPGRVEFRGAGGPIAGFSAEVADTEALREKGLMFRDHLASGEGMLFTYQSPRHPWFWMKNTQIPLDMIFADASGLVTVVQANAKPQDETPIDGGEGVSFVLEIGGGLAARLGIAPGAQMRSDQVTQAGAVWPCR